MITVEDLLNMRVKVGEGTNDFTMSRGSFVYKQSFSYESTLEFVDKNKEGNATKLHFTDPNRKLEHYFIITEDNGDMEVTYESNDDAINRYWISL